MQVLLLLSAALKDTEEDRVSLIVTGLIDLIRQIIKRDFLHHPKLIT